MTEWDDYWKNKSNLHDHLYDNIAIQYREYIIKPYFKKYIYKYFDKGSTLLHAGCGSGQIENCITNNFNVIGMDFSQNALNIYKKYNINSDVIYGNILSVGLKNESVDGIYNLGVMEHFTTSDIRTILIEFNRVLKPNGTIILFVPPEYGSTVIFFKIIHYILNDIFKQNIHFQPAEINRIRSQQHVENLINGTGLKLINFTFEPHDLFTHVAIVLKKIK